MTWFDEAQRITCAEAASRLGMEVVKSGPNAKSTSCPVCGAARRHRRSRDKRGAVGMPSDRPHLWHCFQCEATGSIIDLVAYGVCGKRWSDLDRDGKRQVATWFDPSERSNDVEVHFKPAQLMPEESQLPPAYENAGADYPPLAEVESLWESCVDVIADQEALDYVTFRGARKASEDWDTGGVARALQAASLPPWAAMAGRSWVESGHRLIVPLYDRTGVMRSVVARSVKRNPPIKSSGPAFGRRGLVMAGPIGQMVLGRGPLRGFHARRQLEVLVYEGEISFLQNVHLDGEDCRADGVHGFTAVFGIQAGSWSRDIAARIPAKSVVRIRTHDDEPGKKYAEQIRKQMGTRVECVEELVPND